MGEVGILAPDARVELIKGEIIDMSPIGSRHAGVVARLSCLFERAVGDKAIVWAQNPVVLSDLSEPQPDIDLLKPREDFYTAGHPRPKDILLIVEVADTSFKYDRDVKIPLYAQHGIPEVWLIDVENRKFHWFIDVDTGRYRNESTLEIPGVVSLSGPKEVEVDLTGLFGGWEK